jgi:hypothetical protein
MGEVIDFTTRRREPKDPEVRKLMEKIHSLQDAMNEIYGHIEDAYGNLNVMETEAGKVEQFYDEVILELARKIGGENIPVEFLNFSTRLTPVLQNDGTYKLELQEEEKVEDLEIIFTPDFEPEKE